MVDIYVGPSRKCFRLYKANICRRIPYFNRLFNSSSENAPDNVVYLERDDPGSFDLLTEWANHPLSLTSPSRIRELATVKHKERREERSWDAVGFYSLAEKYCLPEL